LLEKGKSQLESQNWLEASNTFHQFLNKSPNHPAGLLGLLKSNLMQGNYPKAKTIIDEFPLSPEYAQVVIIQPLYEALVKAKAYQEITDDPLESAYHNALLLIIRGNIPAAMDGILDILRQNKHFHNDEVRKVMLGLFEVLGTNHPLTQQYRQELALVLF
jgi:putative thioredoxin